MSRSLFGNYRNLEANGIKANTLNELITDQEIIATNLKLGDNQLITSSDYTITVPNINGTIALSTGGAGIFTNTYLEADSCGFVDQADNTKIIDFDASGLTTGNTRTIIMPDYDLNPVDLSAIQTITNKNITGNKLDSFINSGTSNVITCPVSTSNLATQELNETFTNKKYNADNCLYIDNADNTKTMKFDISNLSTGTDFVLQFRDLSNDYAVLETSNQNLRNKSLVVDYSYFIDDGDNTKIMKLDSSGITTGNTRILTVPDYNGTIATLAGVETLTNKSFQDSTFSIFDDVDNTKIAKFNVAGLTTGTTRLLELPDVDDVLQHQTPITDMCMTGFKEWDASGPYWSNTTTTFNVLVAGSGYINSELVSWSAPQSVVITQNLKNYIYIDDTGTLQVGATVDACNNITLFEVIYDGTNIMVKKENHPYNFQTSINEFFHDNLGTVIKNSGAVLSANATALKLNITPDEVNDHGLSTTIPSGSAITFTVWYTNASGYWTRYSLTDTIPLYYNNSGTPTVLGAGKFGTFRAYVIL
ncbi:MAG: hypothetical protein OEL54_03515, partial [Flavobacteriaceae bacterium]|nr:hypothetical protein [Flavobacteriaceae bacterium]